MIAEDVMIAVCNDISGQNRGKGFPITQRENRFKKGIGWVPANAQITCFNAIAENPYGSVGDLILLPDESTEVSVNFSDGSPNEHFVLGDILNLNGTPWDCCTRSLAKKSLERLKKETGLSILSSFEQEFFYTGVKTDAWSGFGINDFRKGTQFAATFSAALRAAKLEPESFLPEFGTGQYEATVLPTVGIRAADECVIFREMARATAIRLGEKVSFSPKITPETLGNGLHIHFSFLNEKNESVTYDSTRPLQMSELVGQFCAGVLKYLPSIIALTAPSVPSYLRLVPHSWSSAFNNLAVQDREAALRICPINQVGGGSAAEQFNIEYRASDSSASPYLQLAAIVNAGLQGIKDKLPQPKATTGDLTLLNENELKEQNLSRLPTSLEQALEVMEKEKAMKQWFSDNFVDIYLKHKRCEIKEMKDLSIEEICRRYANVY